MEEIKKEAKKAQLRKRERELKDLKAEKKILEHRIEDKRDLVENIRESLENF